MRAQPIATHSHALLARTTGGRGVLRLIITLLTSWLRRTLHSGDARLVPCDRSKRGAPPCGRLVEGVSPVCAFALVARARPVRTLSPGLRRK